MEYGKVNCKDGPYYDGFVKIAETALATTASAVSLSGLNGDVDVEYRLMIRGSMTGGTNSNYLLLQLNGDTSTSNYGSQVLGGQGALTVAVRETGYAGVFISGYQSAIEPDKFVFIKANIYAKTGYVRTIISEAIANLDGTNSPLTLYGHAYADTSTNITSLVVTIYSGAGRIAIGTYFSLWAKRARQ